VLTLSTPGAYTIKWIATDIKGNQSAVQTQQVQIGNRVRSAHHPGDDRDHAVHRRHQHQPPGS
jgi:hypothetical protein